MTAHDDFIATMLPSARKSEAQYGFAAEGLIAINISETDHLRGYDAGAVDYVSVPVIPQILRAKVKVFAELYRKSRQLAVFAIDMPMGDSSDHTSSRSMRVKSARFRSGGGNSL